ncbi:MAG: response regulator [Chloroflexota bacterium]|nr:response regulator [Chloroflexota bacterium]
MTVVCRRHGGTCISFAVVDGSPSNRTIYARIIVSLGVSSCVRTFPDPIAALRWLKDNPADVVVMDYHMTGLDGAEFISLLRSKDGHEDTLAVVVTVDRSRRAAERLRKAGATLILHSPMDIYCLRAELRDLVRAHD